MSMKSNTFRVSYRGHPSFMNYNFLIKRIFDMCVCLLLLPILAPVMLVIALLIIIDSPGNPLFLQKRIGRRNRPFCIYKFRTMRADHDIKADQAFMEAYVAGKLNANDLICQGKTFKPHNQNDYTRVGRLLRKTSLDEIPQLINVLKGEMSIVGPRPNVPYEVQKYQLWHWERLDVLPGITGLAQINGRSAISFNQIARYDIQYVMSYSLSNDLRIIWKTFQQVFTCYGAD